MLLKHVCVDWLGLFMAWSESLCLFPNYTVRALNEHLTFFSALNGQLENCEEQLAEFDKKVYGIRIANCTFKDVFKKY